MATVYHTVHYRLFSIVGANINNESLESLCRKSLDSADSAKRKLWIRPEDRFCKIAESDRQVHLNKVADLTDAIIGEMCLIQENDLQALLSSKASTVKLSKITTAGVYNLDERTAPTGTQFVRGMAYWMAIGNHLFFVKTHGMTAEFMHFYFSWLFQVQTATLTPETGFVLKAEFDRSQLAGDIGDIRALRVSGKSAPQVTVVAPQAPAAPQGRLRRTARRVVEKAAEFEQAVPIVRALLGPDRAESLVASLGKGEYLSVDASVKVMGSRSTESREQMREIANEIADWTDAKVQAEGKDGKLSGGDIILRTNMPFDLPHEGSNLLEFDHVADQLREVYGRFVKDRKIDA
ncbi:hypothetical protein [Sediminicoccus rosea]|uniref:Uncharacterized protein n=1 Tax=Sediminicoccus rosea TaxID=1225128 RepID=A0ABZ0PLV7_9PROT|nr:hypothetical protein [Sediminicoccus rosea]WPB86211.1 hypothetical protein R9Z33_04910 [Sediminicoccus rosea]